MLAFHFALRGTAKRNKGIHQCAHWFMHIPPCGARKTHRAYADPRVFRPLRKLRPCFFCHRQRKAAIPPGLADMIRIPMKQKNRQAKACLFFWCSSGDSHASLFPLRETGKRDKGIHQCAHWFMHTPPACAILIRIPLKKKDSPPRGTVFFWCSSGDSNPGHPA